MNTIIVFLIAVGVVLIFIMSIFRRRSNIPTKGKAANSPHLSATAQAFIKNYWHLIVLVVALIFFAEGIANFDLTNLSIGRLLEEKLGDGAAMALWFIPAAAAAIWLAKVVKSEVAYKVISGAVAVAAVGVILLNLGMAQFGSDKMSKAMVVLGGGQPATGLPGGLRCTTTEDLQRVRIDTFGRDIVVCPDKGSLTMSSLRKHRIVADLSPRFKREYGHLLGSAGADSFVSLQPPHSFRGSTGNSWRVVPLHSQKTLNYVSAYDDRGLSHVILTVRSVQ